MAERYQLAVIGGGPGGYAAALRASALGLETLLIEKESLGGTCLNRGCIPTKTFYHSAHLYGKLKEAEKYGLTAESVGFDFARVQARKQQVVSELVDNVRGLLKKSSVEVAEGKAQVISPNQWEVELPNGETKSFMAETVILATGSQEIHPGVPGEDLPGLMTSREALDLSRLPSSLVVIGGGVIAVEMASIFASFGVEVTIVQRNRLLRREDKEMVRRLSAYLRRQGIKVITEAPLQEIKAEEGGYTVRVQGRKGEQLVSAEKVLLAIGRKPYTGDLDLSSLGVEQEESGVIVDRRMETSYPGIYAVGDVAAPGYFTAHTAYHQGLVAAENAAGRNAYFNPRVVPVCIFTLPQLSRAGLTEEAAQEKGYRIKTSKFPFSANGKAFLQGEGDGVVKLVGDADTGVLLGMHILGPQASDLIQEGTLAVSSGAQVTDLAKLIHPHPTLSETVWESALSFDGNSLHLEGR